MQGVLSIACFTLVGAAFWRFGWKIGLLDLFFAIIAANVPRADERLTAFLELEAAIRVDTKQRRTYRLRQT